MPDTTTTASHTIEHARQLYLTGNYREGFEAINGLWQEGRSTDAEEQAKIELCRGILLGAYDYYVRGNSQDESRKQLHSALDTFTEKKNSEYILYTSNCLAVSYKRTGHIDEALACLAVSYSQGFAEDHGGMLYARLIESNLLLSKEKYNEAASLLSHRRILFGKAHPYLRAQYHQNLGAARFALEQSCELNFQTARNLYESCGHLHYLFIAENNLGFYYLKTGKSNLALRHTNNALVIANRLKNVRLIGGGLDTQAQIALERGELRDALYFAESAISRLIPVGGVLLRDAYETKVRVLLAMKDVTGALAVIAEAALSVDTQKMTNIAAKHFKDSAGVKIVGCPTAANVQGVKMKSDYFAHLGLKKGFVAMIERGAARNGDFAAVFKDGKHYFGFIDAHFGVINLVSGRDASPHFFYVESACVAGKVIGYCKPGSSKLWPLDLRQSQGGR